jgi:hypothetical protein
VKPSTANVQPGFLAKLLAVLLVVVGVAVVALRQPESQASHSPVAKVPSVATNARPSSAATNVLTSSVVTPAVLANQPNFRERPFPVAQESSNVQWTLADGKDTNVIRQLAHNDLEYARMVEENPRILRRQLVYRKDTAAAVMQRARASGEAVKQLTLPGFDGQEIQFQIDRADLEPSQQSGTFTGQLPNRPNSMVTLAFKFGREAFTILSPDDHLFLQAHPREPGELILTSFDPDKYQSVPGGDPIRTSQK